MNMIFFILPVFGLQMPVVTWNYGSLAFLVDLDCCLIVGGWAFQIVPWFHDFSVGFWQYNEIGFFI